MVDVKLREYQLEGIAQERRAFQAGARAVLRQAPTGSGKTEEFCHVARLGAALSTQTIIVVPRKELRAQSSRRLRCAHGIIDADHREAMKQHKIQVATEDTLAMRLEEWYDWADLLIFDECHHDQADKRRRIRASQPRARILGYTATPERLDRRGLGDIYEVLVPGPEVRWLQTTVNPDSALTYLAPCTVYSPAVVDVRGLRAGAAGDFDRDSLLRRAAKLTGDAVEHYRRLADGLPALASCVSVDHAEKVAEAFRGAGYRFVAVSGRTPADIRDQAIEDIGAGRLNGIAYCDLFSEGLDCPGVYVGLMLRPTESLALFLQQVGRILRPFPGKERAILLDHAGNCLRHRMLPDTPVEWRLKTTPEVREAERMAREELSRCPECKCVFAGNECPECGHRLRQGAPRGVPETQAGRLEKLEKIERDPVKKVRRRNRIRAARSEEQLRELAVEWGYKKVWAQIEAKRRRLPRYTAEEHAARAAAAQTGEEVTRG